MVRFPRGCRGPRAWHVVREASGTWETLPPPPIYRLVVGQFNHKKAVATGLKGVRSSHSVRWAAHCSGGLKSLQRSDKGRCIQRRE